MTSPSARARKKLAPDEIQGASFSITNRGVLGRVVGIRIIPEGTSAILGTVATEKKPVVMSVDGADVIPIRKRFNVLDGADAARFLAQLQQTAQSFPEDA